MGYLLLTQGIFDKSELNVVWGKNSLLFKRATPGTFFALFGCAVILMIVWKPLSVDDSSGYYYTSASPNRMEPVFPNRGIPIPNPAKPPSEINSLIDGKMLKDDEQSALAKWLLGTEGTFMPDDIHRLIKDALINGKKLTEAEQYRIKAWLVDPDSFGPVRSVP